MWGGLEEKMAAHFVEKLSKALAEDEEATIPSVGRAEWDGKSDELVVKMTAKFYRELMRDKK